MCQVIDQGSGMTDLEKINISKFFSEKECNGEHLVSTGMGLFITREMVHALAGKITFEDNPLGGTICSFTIPLTIKSYDTKDDNPLDSVENSPIPCIKTLMFKTIGLEFQTITELQQKGMMAIYQADTIAAALDFIKENKIHVIFCDLFDLFDNGQPIAQIIKHSYPDIIILALTSDTIHSTQQELKLLEIDAILAPPFDAELIYKSALAWVPLSSLHTTA